MTLLISLVANAAAVTAPSTIPTVDPQQAARDEIVVTGQRTEGKDDYTIDGQTTATRIPLTLRETPQSVSIVTRQQITDFQLNDVNQLLTTVPGINV